MKDINDVIAILSCVNLFFSIVLGVGVYKIRRKFLQIEINPNLDIYFTRDPINNSVCIYLNNLGPLPIRAVSLYSHEYFKNEIKISDGFVEINKPIKVSNIDDKLKYTPLIQAGDKNYFNCTVRFSNSFKNNRKIKYHHE